LISSVPKPGGKDTLLFDSESRFLLNICLFCFVRGQRYIGYLRVTPSPGGVSN
jgi:hypothetical protein